MNNATSTPDVRRAQLYTVNGAIALCEAFVTFGQSLDLHTVQITGHALRRSIGYPDTLFKKECEKKRRRENILSAF